MAKTNRDRLIQTFMSRNRRKGKGPLDQGFPKNPGGTPTNRPGKASATTDTNLYRLGARSPGRITEDDPRWNASTMGNKTGYYKGTWYEKGKKSRGGRNYNKGNRPG